jgi:uncharacterized membrane protein YeaQ/YmgE (transglycosylase-associated protein family)
LRVVKPARRGSWKRILKARFDPRRADRLINSSLDFRMVSGKSVNMRDNREIETAIIGVAGTIIAAGLFGWLQDTKDNDWLVITVCVVGLILALIAIHKFFRFFDDKKRK